MSDGKKPYMKSQGKRFQAKGMARAKREVQHGWSGLGKAEDLGKIVKGLTILII